MNICDALRDLVVSVQFKKREKHPWLSAILVEQQASACNFTKSKTSSRVFNVF